MQSFSSLAFFNSTTHHTKQKQLQDKKKDTKMRPSPETTTTPQNITQLSSSCEPRTHSCKWWPYSNSNDFGANTAMIIILLLCALICALALNTAIRWFLKGGRDSSSTNNRLPPSQPEVDDQQQQKPNLDAGAAPLVVAPTLVYSAGMKLGGGADQADCAICLSEFTEGEGITVLGSCSHGFHVHCIQQWLYSHSSCPTCRRSCLAPMSQDVPCCSENGLNNTS